MNETKQIISFEETIPLELRSGIYAAATAINARNSILYSAEFIDVHALYGYEKNCITLVNPGGSDGALALASLRLLQVVINSYALSDLSKQKIPAFNVIPYPNVPPEINKFRRYENVTTPVRGKFSRTDVCILHTQEKSMSFAYLAEKYYETLLQDTINSIEIRNVVLMQLSHINDDQIFNAPIPDVPQKGDVIIQLKQNSGRHPCLRPVYLPRIGAMTDSSRNQASTA